LGEWAIPQTYTEHDYLQNVLQLTDAALRAAERAGKGKTSEATEAFLRVQEQIRLFFSLPGRDTPGNRRKKLLDPSTALEAASKKDERSMETLSKIRSTFKAPLPTGPTKVVNFVVLKSLHEGRLDLTIIRQKIDSSTTTTEIAWRFSRYPEKSAERIAATQNPHFYLQLSSEATSFDNKFRKDPLKDLAYGLKQGDTSYVLLDKSCRLFLDTAKPRIFGNLWKPHRTVILKDVGGILESEDIVLSKIGKMQDYWYRPSITDSSHPCVGLGYSDVDSEIVNTPFADARAVIHAAVRAQGVDLMIRDRFRPEPPAESGWRLLPSPGVRAQEPEDQTTPRQSTMRLPQPDDSNFSASNIGNGPLFPTPTPDPADETVINTYEAFLPVRKAGGDRIRLLDKHGTSLQLALPIPDTSLQFPVSPVEPTPVPFPVPYLNPNPSTSSIGSSLFLIPNGSLESLANAPEPHPL
jgi:hypothetical protein